MTDLVFVIIFVGYDAAWHQLLRLYWDKVRLQIGNLSLGEQLLIMVIIVIKMGMMRTFSFVTIFSIEKCSVRLG